MKARVITLLDNAYSEECAQRCIDSSNIPVEPFPAVTPEEAPGIMEDLQLQWTWGTGYSSSVNTSVKHTFVILLQIQSNIGHLI